MKRSFALFIAVLLALSGCKDMMHVQTGYIADRDDCRGRAEGNVGVYSQPESYGLNDKEKNTALLQLFCECMKGKDWKVAGCPKPTVAVAAAPPPPAPTVVVVQSPTAQPGYMAEQPAPVPPPATARTIKRRRVCMPPSVCPAPAEGVTPRSSTAPNASSAPATPQEFEDQQLNGILQRQ